MPHVAHDCGRPGRDYGTPARRRLEPTQRGDDQHDDEDEHEDPDEEPDVRCDDHGSRCTR